MAHDPLSHVASWIIPAILPASANVTDKPPTSAAADDPVLALIAEMKRLDAAMDAINERAVESFATLPEDVQKGQVRVTWRECGLSKHWLQHHFSSEAGLREDLRPIQELFTIVWGSRYKMSEEEVIAELNEKIGFDDVLAQLRAGLAERDAAREASGYLAIERESEELGEQRDRAYDRLTHTKPTTLAGVIAMLDRAAGDLEYRESEIELIEPALAGLREIAATPVIGFGDPEEGGAA